MSASLSPNTAFGSFAVKLDFFSGPMDLLLHLVRQQDISIEQVDMAEVCEQYLQVVMQTAELDLDRASEYLVVAATLLSIKSQALLPFVETEEDSESFDNPEDALRFYEELRRRLLAYEETKRLALNLVETPQLGVDVFRRRDKKALLPEPEELGEGETPFSLGLAFARLLKRIGESVNSMRIRLEPVSVVSFMVKIIDGLGVVGSKTIGGEAKKTFRALLKSFANPAEIRRQHVADEKQVESHARSVIIGSFVAVLELMKRGVIVANQDSSGEITLGPRVEDIGERDQERAHFLSSMQSEFDQPPASSVEDNVIAIDAYREGKQQEIGDQQSEPLRKEANSG